MTNGNTQPHNHFAAPATYSFGFSGWLRRLGTHLGRFSKRLGSFTAWFGVIFLLTLMALWSIGWVPADVEELGSRALASVFESGRASVKDALEDPSGLLANSLEGTAAPQERGAPAVSPEASIEEPIRLRIASLGIDSVVLNPESRDTAVLDRALLSGVVHYPGSGNLDDVSNMFLFGHSTRLREVRNRSFAVFNRLPELRLGDEIEVDGLMATYRYRVISIKEAPADEALVRFERGRKRLTLSTCTTFGARENRIMVEADFVSSTPRPF